MYRQIVVALCLIVTVTSDSKCDTSKCDHVPVKHYQELGCTAVRESGSCCPSRFQCPDKAKFALDKCYWNGRVYNFREELSLNETNALCLGGCYCAEGYPEDGIPAEFICAQIECAHFFTAALNECTRISTLNSCCARHICDDDEKKTLGTTTCTVDGHKYRVGEKIYPNSHPCYSCICSENFDNTTVVGNPACREINCGIGLRNFVDVRFGCIPSYYGENGCCPIGWRCPRTTDVMIPSSTARSALSADPAQQCQYGNLTLTIGDEIKSNHPCTVCKCVIPPMAHCVETPNCKN